jgi:hypothetical protein
MSYFCNPKFCDIMNFEPNRAKAVTNYRDRGKGYVRKKEYKKFRKKL